MCIFFASIAMIRGDNVGALRAAASACLRKASPSQSHSGAIHPATELCALLSALKGDRYIQSSHSQVHVFSPHLLCSPYKHQTFPFLHPGHQCADANETKQCKRRGIQTRNVQGWRDQITVRCTISTPTMSLSPCGAHTTTRSRQLLPAASCASITGLMAFVNPPLSTVQVRV